MRKRQFDRISLIGKGWKLDSKEIKPKNNPAAYSQWAGVESIGEDYSRERR